MTDFERLRSYNRLKQETQEAIAWRLRAAGARPGLLDDRRVRLSFVWHEQTRGRDPDGVSSGGRKLILDALAARNGMGVLHCDGHHCVEGFGGDDFVFPGSPHWRSPGVLVAAEWSHVGETCKPGGVTWWLPGRLPDLNELLAAREQGARRAVARAVRAREHR